MARIRLDKLLVMRGIAGNIEEAVVLIENNKVLVNGALQNSPSSSIDKGHAIELVKDASKYVSRGGYKLEKALSHFHIDLAGKRCLDVGASTGGFTDAMLQSGARHVVAVDVGKGQLDDKIRHHKDVTILEKTNAKDMTADLIGGMCAFAAIDVSFTSIVPLMDAICSVLEPVHIVALIKPQFELAEHNIDARGIVNDPDAHVECLAAIQEQLAPYCVMSHLEFSPITGAKGNIEFVAELKQPHEGERGVSRDRIADCVRAAHELLKKDIA